MNKTQRFVIVRRHKAGKIDVIGTNSGQAFVEGAAAKACLRLTQEGGSYHVVEITKLLDYYKEL